MCLGNTARSDDFGIIPFPICVAYTKQRSFSDAPGPIAVCNLELAVAAAFAASACRPQVYALMRFGFSCTDDCLCI